MTDTLARLTAALADRYRIERELGAGGMATVYLAEDLKLHRKVALKVLRPELAATLGPDRFLQEIDIAAKLTHPHIVPLHDCGEAEGFLYYVMPYVEGESLRDKLAHEGELPIGEAVRILRDVVDALTDAHAHGVVHRDIKPDNVLLTKHHAVVTDFGVAKAVSQATGRQKLTTEGVALGTPTYMSPEQAAADSHIDHRSDIYAVGAVAYELLTGRPPFTGTTSQEVLSAHMTQAPEPVTKYRETVLPALEQLVMKCLEKKPADRWQSAEELLPQLEALVTPSGGITPTGTMPVGRLAKRRWMMAGAAVTVAVIIAVIATLPRASRVRLDPDHVVVAVFRNATGDPSLDQVGERAAHWITQGLQQAAIQVTPWDMALQSSRYVEAEAEAGRVRDPVRALAEETGAGTVISGTIYLEGDSLEIQVNVTDAVRGRSLGSPAPVTGLRQTPRELIGRLTPRVMGLVAVGFDERLAASVDLIGEPPPFEAYQAFAAGMELYIRRDHVEAIPYFQRASALDSTWALPLLFGAINLNNSGQRALADSVMRVMEGFGEKLTPYHRAWVEHTRVFLFDGDRERSLAPIRRAAEMAPRSKAVYNLANALYSVNRSQEAVDALLTLDPERGAMRGWDNYWALLIWALHKLGQHDQELEAARRAHRQYPDGGAFVLQFQSLALAALGRVEDLNNILDEMQTAPDLRWLREAMVRPAEILRANEHFDAAQDVLVRAIDWFEARPHDESATLGHRLWYGRALYLAGRPDEAQPIFDALVDEFPDDLQARGTRAFIAATRGDSTQAMEDGEWFESLDRPYLHGGNTYWRGVIAAALGDLERAMELFREARWFGQTWNAESDMHHAPLLDYPPWQELIRPKG